MTPLRPTRALALVAACAAMLAAAAPAAAQERMARSVALSGTVDPATAAWVQRAVEDAEEDGADLFILRLDTPGGLDTSMRDIVKTLTGAPMPVVTYVAPTGARAASAGLYILLAGDVAAMAPGTNTGSATPVRIGGGGDDEDEVLGRKIRNDAAAYVRALAEARGRNADLAEEMVRDAVNVSAERALRQDLVEFVAADQRALLEEIDGFRVRGPRAQRLETTGMRIESRDMPLQYELRQLLVNPTVAFLLLMGGLLLIVLEVLSPGLVGPGLFGAIALVLGLYGTAQLPLAAAGILLLVLALGLLLAETQVPSGGLLGGAGVAALIAGGLLLYDTDSDAIGISAPVVIAVGALLGGFTLFAGSRALAARHEPVHGGLESMVGMTGTVRSALDPAGQVYVDGALWRARPAEGAAAPAVGEPAVVEDVEGLTLRVRAPDVQDGQPERKQS